MLEMGRCVMPVLRPIGMNTKNSFLPIVNSPRVGVCGYTGGQDFVYWDEEEDEEYEDEEDEEDAEK